jgi:uncharacterized RDD family membrane protein YckC
MTEPQCSRPEAAADSGQPNNDIWRKEVHSRVARFRTRRGRRITGAFSMRFPFPPTEPVAATSAVTAEQSSLELNIAVDELAGTTAVESKPETSSIDVASEDSARKSAESLAASGSPELTATPVTVEETLIPAESSAVAAEIPMETASSQLPDVETPPPRIMQPRPRPKRKVIAFPRQPEAAATVHRLADPVLPEGPRILDVPEELEAYPSTPFLDGLQFEPAAQTPAVPADHVELPFRAVGIPQRIYAALMDCVAVAVAAVAFAFVGHKMLPDLALTKPVRLTAALVLLLLWALYQYLLLVYAGRTAGMRVAGIRLRTFKGRQPSLRHRRNRVLGLYLSTASLVMGLLWALVDIDTLCWHDRISGTYLTKSE